MQTELTTKNLEMSITNKKTLDTAKEMLVNRKYEELEELLRVESLSASDRALILNRMYAEISNKNLYRELDEYNM